MVIDQPAQNPGEVRKPVGHERGRGPAGPGHVETDDCRVRVEFGDQWVEDLQSGADPVAQHERDSGTAAHADPDPLAAGGEDRHVGPAAVVKQLGHGHRYSTTTSAMQAGRSAPSTVNVSPNTASTPPGFCSAPVTATVARTGEPARTGAGNRTLFSP